MSDLNNANRIPEVQAAFGVLSQRLAGLSESLAAIRSERQQLMDRIDPYYRDRPRQRQPIIEPPVDQKNKEIMECSIVAGRVREMTAMVDSMLNESADIIHDLKEMREKFEG